MVFEIIGFLSGGAGIGTAWMLLLRYERGKVFNGFYAHGPSRSPGGNALIWPPR